ncbi:hypothetical protein GCM10025794_23390 [Massilia kyonggiensis]
MNRHRARWSLVLLACLMLVACQDRREPVKPTVVLANRHRRHGLTAPAARPAPPSGPVRGPVPPCILVLESSLP